MVRKDHKQNLPGCWIGEYIRNLWYLSLCCFNRGDYIDRAMETLKIHGTKLWTESDLQLSLQHRMISRGIQQKVKYRTNTRSERNGGHIWLHQHRQHTVTFNSCFIYDSNTNCYKKSKQIIPLRTHCTVLCIFYWLAWNLIIFQLI
jgi:hypothetical protein